MRQNGLDATGILQRDLGRVDPILRKVLINGSGDHFLLAFLEQPRGGNYRIRIDNRKVTTPTRAAAVFVRASGLGLESLRSTPGVIITDAVKVPPASAGVELRLTLGQSNEQALIDVASTQAGVAIRLRLPDGTVVTQENANANGLGWTQMRYPADITDGDPLAAPFAAMTLGAMILPVDGVHSLIEFPAGVRQAGTYTVEVDGQRSTAPAEVSAMFVPIKDSLQRADEGFQRLISPPAN